MAILLLIVILGLLIVIVKKDIESENSSNSEIPSTIHYSNEFNHEEPVKRIDYDHNSNEFNREEPIKRIDYNHMITTILIYEENSNMWICPSCETENPLSKHSCCVCHYVQQKGA